ncbi:MAG: carotenoid biosynthesis protein [Anaerolineales bacterium]
MKRISTPLVLWLLTMISLPIVGWILGEDWLMRGMSAAVLMQALAVSLILYQAWGLARTLKTLAALLALAYLAELLGSSSGIPFGKYHYTVILQPQIAGVPLLIPLAWLMMLPPAWALAEIIAPRRAPILHAALSALAFTTWDLFLDPQMTGWGFWRWEIPGQYFGIPLSNYLGWVLVSALMTLLLRPRELPLKPLALIYTLTWALQTVGQGIFWGQPGPALTGFLFSGVFVLLAWKKLRAAG